MTRKPIIGFISFALGVLGLAGAVFGGELADRISPPPPVEEKIADSVVRVRDAVVAKLKDRNADIAHHEPAPSLRVRALQASLGFAILGVVGAGVSYARREDRRVAMAAGAIASIGLLWQAMMFALGVLVLCVIVLLVLSKLDLSL